VVVVSVQSRRQAQDVANLVRAAGCTVINVVMETGSRMWIVQKTMQHAERMVATATRDMEMVDGMSVGIRVFECICYV